MIAQLTLLEMATPVNVEERHTDDLVLCTAPSRNFFSDKITLRTESLRSSYPTDLGRSTLLAG